MVVYGRLGACAARRHADDGGMSLPNDTYAPREGHLVRAACRRPSDHSMWAKRLRRARRLRTVRMWIWQGVTVAVVLWFLWAFTYFCETCGEVR